MRHRIPTGTRIIPYPATDGAIGEPRLSTVEVIFEADDILEQITLANPRENAPARFLRFTLGENPSRFDSYLVRASDIVAADP